MKVIIADDDPTTRVVLSSLVEKMGYESIAVADGEAAWQAYQDIQSLCLMLVDWDMPVLDGLALCQRVKQNAQLNPPYLMLITGKNETDDIVNGLKVGADDYICKPFNTTELMARIQVAERHLNLLGELHQVRQALNYQATHDDLTGLLNRRAVLESIHKEAKRCLRLGHGLHLAICDIDNFKQINDNYGHIVGDRVLQTISHCLQQELRKYDLVGRYGGEEFIIVVNDENEEAQLVFDRLLAAVAKLPLPVGDSDNLNLTISIGTSSESKNFSEARIIEMLAEADRRLYMAKAAGKNRIVSKEPANKSQVFSVGSKSTYSHLP